MGHYRSANNHMSRKALISFYNDMLSEGKIEVDGAAHQRLKDLQQAENSSRETKNKVMYYKRLKDMKARTQAKRIRDLEDK